VCTVGSHLSLHRTGPNSWCAVSKNASAAGELSITGGRGMPIRCIDRCAATVKKSGGMPTQPTRENIGRNIPMPLSGIVSLNGGGISAGESSVLSRTT
jgi:hypothetical protein